MQLFNQTGPFFQVQAGIILGHLGVDIVVTDNRRILFAEGEGPEIGGGIGRAGGYGECDLDTRETLAVLSQHAQEHRSLRGIQLTLDANISE